VVSPKIKARRATDSAQVALNFEPGLAQRYPSLRECIATGVYQRGLSNVVPSINKAPGNLSVELSEDPARNFSVDSLEAYIQKFGDLTPIYYLVDKYIAERAPEVNNSAALAQLPEALAQVLALAKQAGLA
jgi:hypothetical protein